MKIKARQHVNTKQNGVKRQENQDKNEKKHKLNKQ